MSRMRRRWASLVVAFLVAGGIGASAAPIGGLPAGFDQDESDAKDDHDPIKIDSNQELMTPDAVSGNGVRRGLGTAENPYVIEDWRIRFEPSQPGIWIQFTDRHVVIQDIAFEPTGMGSAVTYVWIRGSNHVEVRNLSVVGAEQNVAFLVNSGQNITFRNVTVDGSGQIQARNSQIAMTDLEMDGVYAGVSLLGGEYAIDGSRLEIPSDEYGQGASMPAVSLGTDRYRPNGTCLLTILETTILNDRSPGVGPGTSCEAVVRNSTLRGRGGGIRASDKSSTSIEHALLDGAPFASGREGSGPTGVHLGSNASVSISNVTIERYRTALMADGAGITVREGALRSYDIGIDILGLCQPCKIRGTAFLDPSGTHIRNQGPSTVDARHNWWGSPSGPSDDKVEGDVLVEPWRTEGPAPPSTQDRALPGFGLAWLVAAGVAVLVGRRLAA